LKEVRLVKRLGWGVLLLLTACAPTIRSGLNPLSACGYHVDLPTGWKKVDTDKHLLITRDGAYMQYILVQRFPLDRPFKNTKKTFREDMLPQELAEVVIDEMSSDPFISNLRIMENSPAELKGMHGYRLVFSYATPAGDRHQTVYYGFKKGRWYYSIRYDASDLLLMERDSKDFETLLSSFTLLEQTGARE
jgi:hypothetical protein